MVVILILLPTKIGTEKSLHNLASHLASLDAYLIQKLKATGILDSTVVLETTDMGHADIHSASLVAYTIAGDGTRINRGVVTMPERVTTIRMFYIPQVKHVGSISASVKKFPVLLQVNPNFDVEIST